LQRLPSEAESFAINTYANKFYDDIAQYVPGYVPTAGRGSWKAKLCVPDGANNTIAILSAPGYDYQDTLQTRHHVSIGSKSRRARKEASRSRGSKRAITNLLCTPRTSLATSSTTAPSQSRLVRRPTLGQSRGQPRVTGKSYGDSACRISLPGSTSTAISVTHITRSIPQNIVYGEDGESAWLRRDHSHTHQP